MKEVGHIFISKIKIQNIKGKATWENTFDGLCSNKVNLFVAPNGFGKSTLTAAFTAASHGRMRLDNDDYYNQDACNIPKLEITVMIMAQSIESNRIISMEMYLELSTYMLLIALYMQRQQDVIWEDMLLSQQSCLYEISKCVKKWST